MFTVENLSQASCKVREKIGSLDFVAFYRQLAESGAPESRVYILPTPPFGYHYSDCFSSYVYEKLKSLQY
jgi:hypothetical protein